MAWRWEMSRHTWQALFRMVTWAQHITCCCMAARYLVDKTFGEWKSVTFCYFRLSARRLYVHFHLCVCLSVIWIPQNILMIWHETLHKKATIHQVTTLQDTSKHVLFPGHNHLLTTGTDGPSLTGTQAIIEVSSHQYRWFAGGYDLELGHF